MSIFDSINSIKGIGVKKAQAFNKLGVKTIYDLFCFYPKRYEDRTKISSLGLISDGESACVHSVIATAPTLSRIRKGLELVKFKITDNTATAEVTFFNQPYLKTLFQKGDEFIFFGKFNLDNGKISLTNPVFEIADGICEKTNIIKPVYSLVHGLTQNDVCKAVSSVIDKHNNEIADYIPEDIVRSEKLCSVSFAYKNIHQPQSIDSLNMSRNRLVFEELFLLSLSLCKKRSEKSSKSGIVMSVPDMSEFFSSLPFKPTNAQNRAISDSIDDLISGRPMNRLIQGDVGSGKTLVAAALFFFVFKNGYSSAMMVPTEILAHQHYETLRRLLEPFGMKIALLTGSTKNKSEIKSFLKNGTVDLIIGTHALFSDDVEYSNLALIVTDEQHRFGVKHRSKLISKTASPHVCVMSATPIPRTLSLIIYGDLDISVIDELPPGRKEIHTYVVNGTYRKRLNEFIRKTCINGNQVYIVCPKIEEDELPETNLLSAEQHCDDLKKALPELNIKCIHGKMKNVEKDNVMSSFSSGETDVLVSTTVIEVGVDVPNASLIIIENAERFGLSQLHQLRGRVGRGNDESYCVLVSDSHKEETVNRLNILCKTNDGFKIAEEDLRLRGPGDFLGDRQHGLPEMHIAQLGTDSAMLVKAQNYAKQILVSDPDLSEHILLKQKTESLLNNNSVTLN